MARECVGFALHGCCCMFVDGFALVYLSVTILSWSGFFSEASGSSRTMAAVLCRFRCSRTGQTGVGGRLRSGIDCQTLTRCGSAFFRKLAGHFVRVVQ